MTNEQKWFGLQDPYTASTQYSLVWYYTGNNILVFIYGRTPTMCVLTTGLSISGLDCTNPIIIVGPYSIQVSQQEVQMPRDDRQQFYWLQ